MKKITIFLTLFVASSNFYAQVFFGLYNFDSVKTTTGTTDPSFLPTATGVTFGSFSAMGTPANPNAAMRFSFTDWAIGSVNTDSLYSQMTGFLDSSEYYEVTLTPQSGYAISFDSIRFRMERSGTGIRTFGIASSLDNFSSFLPSIANAPSFGAAPNYLIVEPGNIFFYSADATTPQNKGAAILTGVSGFSNITSPITFRFYAWNAEGSGGTFSIDNVRFVGTTSVAIGIKETQNNDISISPNPSVNGLFTFKLPSYQNSNSISIYNILGEKIWNDENVYGSSHTIDLRNQPNGIYFAAIQNKNNVITKKIIISK